MFGHETDELLREIRDVLKEIRAELKPAKPEPKSVVIFQIDRGEKKMAAITGTQAGGNPSTFEADGMFNGAVDSFPAGSVYTWSLATPDPNVSLGPDSGPDGNQVTASVAAADTNPSYGLSVSVQMPTPSSGTAPAPLTATVTVPIIAAPAPVPSSVVINQIS